MRSRTVLARAHFFDKSVHHPKIKSTISGRNEDKIIEILKDLGYELGLDYVRQHPIAATYVVDFAFLHEQVVLEVDGENHRSKKKQKEDDHRDFVIRHKGWVTIRIPEWKYDRNPSFYKALIKEVVSERREQYETYKLERDTSAE